MRGQSKKQNATVQKQEIARPNIQLKLDSFNAHQSIILIYENINHLAQLQQGSKDANAAEQLILQFFRERYQGVCYRNTYIKEISKILSRSHTRIENIREGGVTYQADCLVDASTIQIPQFIVLNCEVQSCSRHNNKAEFMVRRGELKMFIEDDDTDLIVQGMIIPCVIHEVEYHNGKQFIGAFGTIFKKLQIKQQYNIIGQSQQNNSAIESAYQKVELLHKNIIDSAKHNDPIQLSKIVQLLSGHPATKSICQFNPNAIKKLIECKQGPIFMDMTGFITGNITRELDASVQCIDGSDQDVIYQLLVGVERWMILYYELVHILENTKNREVLESII